MTTSRVGVIQGDKVDPLDHSVVFARPEVTDQCHRLAIGFIENTVINTQSAAKKT